MILKAFDNDCGIITVDNLEDVYKVASFASDETIKDYSIEQEGGFITVTYVTAKDKELKFAVDFGTDFDELDVGLSEAPTAFIYLGGHTKLDSMFNVGQSYPIHRTREDGAVVLKGDDKKGYAVPQKFIDFYFEPSSEQSRLEGIQDERGTDQLRDEQMNMDMGMEDVSEFGEESLY